MIVYGNVVRFKQKPKTLYVVKESKYEGKNLDRIVLIPFDNCNSSTHISRKHPLTTETYMYDSCPDRCDCWAENSGCATHKIPSPVYNVDEVEFVTDCVNDFIMKKFKDMIYS